MLPASDRYTGPNRPECDPDRDNFAIIMAMATYVRDALGGEPAERVERRLQYVQDCIAASKARGMLHAVSDPALNDMISAVETARDRIARAKVDETIAAYLTDSASMRGAATEPPPRALEAMMSVGDLARDRAAAIWRALALVLVPSGGGEQ